MLKSTIPRNMKIMMMMTTSEELVLVMTMMMVSLFRISRQNKSSPYFPIRCVLNQILCSLTINIQMMMITTTTIMKYWGQVHISPLYGFISFSALNNCPSHSHALTHPLTSADSYFLHVHLSFRPRENRRRRYQGRFRSGWWWQRRLNRR